jgi:hypothetical protein
MSIVTRKLYDARPVLMDGWATKLATRCFTRAGQEAPHKCWYYDSALHRLCIQMASSRRSFSKVASESLLRQHIRPDQTQE